MIRLTHTNRHTDTYIYRKVFLMYNFIWHHTKDKTELSSHLSISSCVSLLHLIIILLLGFQFKRSSVESKKTAISSSYFALKSRFVRSIWFRSRFSPLPFFVITWESSWISERKVLDSQTLLEMKHDFLQEFTWQYLMMGNQETCWFLFSALILSCESKYTYICIHESSIHSFLATQSRSKTRETIFLFQLLLQHFSHESDWFVGMFEEGWWAE